MKEMKKFHLSLKSTTERTKFPGVNSWRRTRLGIRTKSFSVSPLYLCKLEFFFAVVFMHTLYFECVSVNTSSFKRPDSSVLLNLH